MAKYDYDLFVIGGGSGGVRAARVAASYGAKVGIAEEYRYGGTCVIRGCVPKKLLVYASRFRDDFEDAGGFGWSVPAGSFDWPTLITNKDIEIARLESAYRRNLERAGVEMLTARAVVEEPQRVRLVGPGRSVTAHTILIATGGTPNRDAQLPGIEHTITSDEAFQLEALPKRVVIVGGGYIAVEFAGIFHGLGAETTLLYRGEKILRGFDEDLRDGLTMALGKRGISIVTGKVFTRIERTAAGRVGYLDEGGALEAEQIMVATGRRPNTNGLGLGKAGVALSPAGAVKVDADSRSTVPSIYAVGDVTNRVKLTPVAIREGHAFADSVFGNRPWRVDYKIIPSAVFSTPELGTVGLSEAVARSRVRSLDIYKTHFRPLKHALAGRDEHSIMKLVVDRTTQRVLGVHVLGPEAAEIVQMAAIALQMRATKQDFDSTMALHPTAAEELLTMREQWVPEPLAAE
jgi:glutathione reductase (NADPH)